MNSVLDRIPDTETVKDLLVKDPSFRALWNQYLTAVETTQMPKELELTSTGEEVKRVISELPESMRVHIYADMLNEVDNQLQIKAKLADNSSTGGVIHQVRSDVNLFRWVIKAIVILFGLAIVMCIGGAIILLYASGKVADESVLTPLINGSVEFFKLLLDFFK